MEESNLALEVLKQMKEQHTSIVKKLIAAIVIITILFIGTNVFWIYKCYEPTSTETYDIDSQDEGNAVYNDSGKVNINGENKSNKN